jgi:hypothetical protein
MRFGDRIHSVVRIWNATQDQPIGGGFLLDHEHIMTCAHVVGEATGKRVELEQREAAPLELSVAFDFVAAQREYGGQMYTARPVDDQKWYPEKGTRSPRDIAVLRLDPGPTLPKDVMPVVACDKIVLEEPFLAYGIKDGVPDGTYVKGTFVGEIPPDRVEVISERPDQAIREGCSGAGVWTRFGLAGMIVEMQSETSLGRVIPIEQLEKVWRFDKQVAALPLEESNAPGVGDAMAIGRRLSSLLHTFDREAQEGDFDRAIDTLWAGQQRPIVCAISGLADDRPLLCRDRCVRLPLRDLLDRMKLSGRPPTVRHIRWPGKGGRDSLSCLK